MTFLLVQGEQISKKNSIEIKSIFVIEKEENVDSVSTFPHHLFLPSLTGVYFSEKSESGLLSEGNRSGGAPAAHHPASSCNYLIIRTARTRSESKNRESGLILDSCYETIQGCASIRQV